MKMTQWVKTMRWIAAGLGGLGLSAVGSSGVAQEGALTELYGYGVHRYYAGDYQEAQRALNIVIDAGVEDPRPHYFRGLVTYQMGMADAAKSDFEHAADLEARGKGAANIGRALERIQGHVRREIEQARMMARVAVAQELRAQKELNAQQGQTSPNIARPPAGATDSLPPAMSDQAPAAPATPPAITPDTQVDPFKDDAVPAPAAPADPFSTPAAPATPDASADPFNTPAAPATPDASADPFNTPAAPAAPDNPFGDAPAAPADAAPDPFQ